MRKLFRLAGLLAMTGVMASCSSEQTTANYEVIPIPQEISAIAGGDFTLAKGTQIVYPAGNEMMKRNAEFLADYLKQNTGNTYSVVEGTEGKGNILLTLGATSEKPEGYKLTVNADGVVIAGASEAGVFYGIQTLRKSIPVVSASTPVLNAVEINDYPRFDYRGIHFDVARHFFTLDEVKSFIDMMALHNMNVMHWHLTEDQGWRLEIKKYPLLTEIGSKRTETVIGRNSGKYDGKPYGGFYTQDDAREIVAYAAERYITVIPEIDLPGHMQGALAAYPNLGCTGGPYEVWREWGVSEEVLCAGNDSVLTFIEDVLTEVMDIFPYEYIHIGGDECPKERWAECPKCQARIKALGIKGDSKHSKEEYLQSFIINHAEKFLNENGRQIIGWDEILEGGLAPNATVMSWRGEAGGIEAAKQGHDVIMTPNTYLYFDYYQSTDTDNEPLAIGGYLPLERVYSYEPMPASLTPEEQKHIVGVQANHWTEYMPTYAQVEYMALPRWAALAEIQWTNPSKKHYDEFLQRLPRLINIYDQQGYNYAKHIYDAKVNFISNPEKGTVDVVAETIDNAPVYYTVDGTVPTTSSARLDSVVSIKENCVVTVAAIRPSGASRPVSEQIAFSKSTNKPIVANLPVNKQYEFNGVSTLVDGLKGNGNYKTGRWIAFYRNDMDVTVDMVQPTEISSVAITTNVEKGDWIMDTRGITVQVSDNGSDFKTVATEAYPAMGKDDRNGLYEHKLTFSPVTAKFVRVIALSEQTMPEWHGGKGKPSFLFVDELTID